MKIEPTKLQRIIELASASKSGKPTIEEIALDFQEDKIVSCNKDKSITILAIGNFKKEMFEEYQPIGKVVLRATDLLNRLGKSFKGDKHIEFTIKKDKINLIGKNEFYEEKVLPETKLEQDIEKFEKTPNGYKIQKNELTSEFNLEITQLDDLGTDRIVLQHAQGQLKAEAKSTTSTYVRTLEIGSHKGDGEEEVTLDTARIQKVVGLLAGPVWLLLTKEGPVSMSYKDQEMDVSYIIAPIKE